MTTLVQHLSQDRVAALARQHHAIIVDVRESSEYKAGHIPRSRHISLSQLVHRLREIPKGRPIVVVCRSGSRSQRAAELLQKAGFQHVYNMSGGMQGWQGPVSV